MRERLVAGLLQPASKTRRRCSTSTLSEWCMARSHKRLAENSKPWCSIAILGLTKVPPKEPRIGVAAARSNSPAVCGIPPLVAHSAFSEGLTLADILHFDRAGTGSALSDSIVKGPSLELKVAQWICRQRPGATTLKVPRELSEALNCVLRSEIELHSRGAQHYTASLRMSCGGR
jgi:hypothetical protein